MSFKNDALSMSNMAIRKKLTPKKKATGGLERCDFVIEISLKISQAR
jgi:hypothetical protein